MDLGIFVTSDLDTVYTAKDGTKHIDEDSAVLHLLNKYEDLIEHQRAENKLLTKTIENLKASQSDGVGSAENLLREEIRKLEKECRSRADLNQDRYAIINRLELENSELLERHSETLTTIQNLKEEILIAQGDK